MSLVRENSIGVAASVLPWTYLAGGAAAAIALVLLSKKLAASPTHKNGVPLPPGPPASWFWQYPLPKKKYVYSVQRISSAEANTLLGGNSTLSFFFRVLSIVQELATLVEQYGPVVSFRRGSHVTIVIGRMDVRLRPS